MADGSHATWEGMPRICQGCGQPLRITKDVIWLDVFHGSSWHFACRPVPRELTLDDVPDASERLRALERRVAAVERRLAKTESSAT